MNQKQPLWTRDFLLIALANLMVFTSFYFLLPTLPVFVTDYLRGDKSEVGYIIGVLSITAVLIRPLSGFLLDTLGRKRIVLVALLALVFVMGAYNLVTSLALLLLLRVFHGFFWGVTTTGLSTVAADVVPPARRGEGLGYYGLSNTLAMAVGPGIGLLILAKGGFHTLFNASFVISIIALIFAFAIKYRTKLSGGRREAISFESLFEPKVFPLSGIMFFIAFVYGGIVSFITLLGKEINIANAGTFFMVYAVTILFVRPFAGKAFDQRGPFKIMVVGFVAIVIAFVLLYLSTGLALFVLAAVAMGVGYGIVQPSLQAMAINRVADYRRGAANGTLMSAFDLGIGLGSILLGVLSKVVGLHKMYLVCGLIIVIPLVLFYLQEGRGKRVSH